MTNNTKTSFNYKPHLTNCEKAFCYTPIHIDPIKASVCLILFQNFLGIENHSYPPYKSRLDFMKGSTKHPQSVAMVNDVNNHLLMPPESTTQLTLDELNHTINGWITRHKSQLKVSYLPQVPCAAFSFPVDNEEEAIEIRDLLCKFDSYLLSECENMRVDYANMVFIEIFEDDEWQSWCKEVGEDYFEEGDIEEYVKSKTAQ